MKKRIKSKKTKITKSSYPAHWGSCYGCLNYESSKNRCYSIIRSYTSSYFNRMSRSETQILDMYRGIVKILCKDKVSIDKNNKDVYSDVFPNNLIHMNDEGKCPFRGHYEELPDYGQSSIRDEIFRLGIKCNLSIARYDDIVVYKCRGKGKNTVYNKPYK